MADTERSEYKFPDESRETKEETSTYIVEEDDKGNFTAKPEIEIVDDTPEKDRNRSLMTEPPTDPTQEELEGYSESVRQRIKHFTKGYHEERRAKEAAQREKDEALRVAQVVVEENRKLQGSLSQNQTALVDQAKKAVTAEADAAKRLYKEKMEAFDTDGAIEAQEALTQARIKLDKLNNFRPAPVQNPKDVVQTQQSPQQQSAQDPKLKNWTDENTWFGSNKRMTAYALGLHEDLVAEGVDASSAEYYKRIDTDMKKRFPEELGSRSSADAPTQRNRTNVVAPATRSTATRKVVLSQTAVALAKRLNIPLDVYARQVAKESRN